MVKKVEYRGSFLTEYKKDIEGASELLKKLPKNEKLKKSMAQCTRTSHTITRMKLAVIS